MQPACKQAFEFDGSEPHAQNKHAEGRRHFAKHGDHVADLRQNLPVFRADLEARQEKGKGGENGERGGIEHDFFDADVLFIARDNGGNERPAQKTHGKEVHHGINGDVGRIGKDRFEHGDPEERAVGKGRGDGGDTVTYVLHFFAEDQIKRAEENKLHGGDDRKKDNEIEPERGGEIGFVKGVKRQRGLAYVH